MADGAPTPERWRRALRAGDSPISNAAVRAAALATFILLAPGAVHALESRFIERLRAALRAPEAATATSVAADVATLVGPLLLAAFLVASFAGLVQTSGAITWNRTGADGKRTGARLGRLFDAARFVTAARGAAVVVVALGAALLFLVHAAPELAHAVDDRHALADISSATLDHALLAVLAVALSFAAMDVVHQRALFARRWTLSQRDLKRERRDDEGDPEIKRARRRAYDVL